MATRLGEFFVEEVRPAKVRIERSGEMTASREFKTRWQDAPLIAQWLLPRSEVQGSGGILVVPGQSFPGFPQLLVDSIEVEAFDPSNPGDDDATGLPTAPSGATLVVSYSTLAIEEGHTEEGGDGQVSLSLSTQIGGEYLKLGSRFRWSSDNKVNQSEDAEAHLLIPFVEFAVTIDRSPILPLHTWKAAVGRVNSEPMPLFDDAEPGTILFVGCNASRTIAIPDGMGGVDSLWQLELRLSQRIIEDGDDVRGWNSLYRQGIGWDDVLLEDGSKLYKEFDLNQLFSPSLPPAEEE